LPGWAARKNWTWTTPSSTAANAGWTSRWCPAPQQRQSAALMDVGGTMDEHIHRVEEMFSANKSEFKHLSSISLHNCVCRLHVEEQPPSSAKSLPPGTSCAKLQGHKLILSATYHEPV
jgi:uncharacterized protein with von Willebrand factor type A (vWA) domain